MMNSMKYFHWFKFDEPIGQKLNGFRKIYYIELLLLSFNLAQGIRTAVNFTSFYAKVCREIYWDSSEICLSLKQNKSVEYFVQQEMARWLMYIQLITFLPILATSMFFGSFCDMYGRKIPTLISIGCTVLHNFLYMLLVFVPIFPVYSLVIEAGVIYMGGSKSVFTAAQYAEAANQTKDKDKLTQRFSILTACNPLAIFLSGIVGKVLLNYLSLSWIMLIGQIMMALTFLMALILYTNHVEVSADKKNKKSNYCEWFSKMLKLYKLSWKTLTKIRPNHGRVHLLLICFIGLIYSTNDAGIYPVFMLYAFHEPLSWTAGNYSLWMAIENLLQLIGGLSGVYLMKRLKHSDYTVVFVGLVSSISRLLVTCFAKNTWMMYLSLLVGCLSNVGLTSLRSLITLLGSSDETGELTALLSIVIGWSQLTGTVICNNVYAATLNHFIGATFVLMALLLTLCVVIVIGLAVHSKRFQKKSESSVVYHNGT